MSISRHSAPVLRACFVAAALCLVVLGCKGPDTRRAAKGMAPSHGAPATVGSLAQRTKPADPFIQMRKQLNGIPGPIVRLVTEWDVESPHSPEETGKYADAVESINGIVGQLERIAARPDVERFFAAPADVQLEVDYGWTMCEATRYMCAAALAAHFGGDDAAAVKHLAAAIGFANASTASPSSSVTLNRLYCYDKPFACARLILGESRLEDDDACALSSALYEAVTGRRLMASIRSIWDEDSGDGARSVHGYWMLWSHRVDYGDKGDAASGEAAPQVRETEIARLATPELVKRFREDLAKSDELRAAVLDSITWPYYSLSADGPWTAILDRSWVDSAYPFAYHKQDLLATILWQQNNLIARAALLDIMIEVRSFEAHSGRLPETLDEILRVIHEVEEEHPTANRAFPAYTDPYSGEPYRYVLTRDEAGRAAYFKVYSVGIDGRDDGGVWRRGYKEQRERSDIVIAGKAITSNP